MRHWLEATRLRAEPALPALALPARGVPEFRACKRSRATLGPVEARAVGTESPEAGAWGRGAARQESRARLQGRGPGPPARSPERPLPCGHIAHASAGTRGVNQRLSVEVVFSCFEKNTYSSYSEDGEKKLPLFLA